MIPVLPIYSMGSDVQERNDPIFKPDAVEQPELPADLVRVDAFPFPDLSEPELGRVRAVQKLQDGFIDSLSRFRAKVLVAPTEYTCGLGFPGQVPSIRSGEGSGQVPLGS